jgi:4-hydroxy-tetrahydrodipicolinate synthase
LKSAASLPNSLSKYPLAAAQSVLGPRRNPSRKNSALVDRFDKAGADSILVVTPYYASPPQRGFVSYFAKLGTRTNKPFLIHHIPARAGFTLTVDTLAAIKDKAPNFRGLKNTDSDVGLVTGACARLGRDFRIFAGLELPTLPMLSIGGCGMMITASNVAPRMVPQLYDTLPKGIAMAPSPSI